MTPEHEQSLTAIEQTAADNALVELIVSVAKDAFIAGAEAVHNAWLDGNGQREADFGEAADDYANSIDPDSIEAAERIKSLQAEVRALEHHRSMTANFMAVLLTKKDEAEADRQRMRDALERIDGIGDWRPRDRLKEIRAIARDALNPASTETKS